MTIESIFLRVYICIFAVYMYINQSPRNIEYNICL